METSANSEVKPFKSAHSFAQLAVILMVLMAFIFVISAVTDLAEIDLLNAMNDEELVMMLSDEYIDYVDFWFITFGYLQLGWYPTLAVFLIWFYKVYRNLPSLGATGLEFRAKTVVAYFFIPIVSLWKPYEATEEIWKASDPTVITSDRLSRRESALSVFVIAWWIFWVISNIAGWYSLRQTWDVEESIEAYIRSDWIYFFSEIVAAASVILTIPLIREIDKRQAKKILVMKSITAPDQASESSGDKRNEDGQDFQSLKP